MHANVVFFLIIFVGCNGDVGDKRDRRFAKESAYPVSGARNENRESAYAVVAPVGAKENVYSVAAPPKKQSRYDLAGQTGNHNGESESPYSIIRPITGSTSPDKVYSISPAKSGGFSGRHGSAYSVSQGGYQREDGVKYEASEDDLEEVEGPAPLSTNIELSSITIKRENVYEIDNSEPATEDKPTKCYDTQTTHNGEPACKGQLLFKDDFNTLNPNKWNHDILIPTKPDYEFVAYVQAANNTYINDGILNIKPTLTADLSHENIIRLGAITLQGCTAAIHGGSCTLQASRFNILPPILSSRIRTRHAFSFRYGRVEIVAKLPIGDWIYPQLYLEPKSNKYGKGYQSGRVVLGLIRSNKKLLNPTTNEDIGSKLLSVGCLYRPHDDFTENFNKYVNKMSDEAWNDKFHNFSLVWTPESLEFFVDGGHLGKCKLPNAGNRRTLPWKNGNATAPFDDEFYLTIGVAAGGIREFPKRLIVEDDHEKPWSNSGNKDVLTFWRDKDHWYKTWSANSTLQIDSIKVFAL